MRTEKKVNTEASVSRPECAASATRLRLPVTTPAASFAAAKSSETTTETQVTRAFSRRSAFCPIGVSCTPRNLPRGRQKRAGTRWIERVDTPCSERPSGLLAAAVAHRFEEMRSVRRFEHDATALNCTPTQLTCPPRRSLERKAPRTHALEALPLLSTATSLVWRKYLKPIWRLSRCPVLFSFRKRALYPSIGNRLKPLR